MVNDVRVRRGIGQEGTPTCPPSSHQACHARASNLQERTKETVSPPSGTARPFPAEGLPAGLRRPTTGPELAMLLDEVSGVRDEGMDPAEQLVHVGAVVVGGVLSFIRKLYEGRVDMAVARCHWSGCVQLLRDRRQIVYGRVAGLSLER